MLFFYVFFFFKQKTAYEIVSGDWSSDVCSSDLRVWAGTPYPTQGAALTTGVTLARRLRLSTTLEYRGGQTLFNETAWARCLYPAVCREANDRSTPLADQARVASGYALTTA